jgi:hypothetical protein
MRKQFLAALFGLLLIAAPCTLDGGEAIRMQVSPMVSRAPALLTVRVMIEAPADSRFLQVVAQSADFYRSSEIPIDGPNASFLKVFEFSNLPTGTYEVTGVLLGNHGPRASVSRVAQVVPSPGYR